MIAKTCPPGHEPCDYIATPCPGGERTERGDGTPGVEDLECPECHGTGYVPVGTYEAQARRELQNAKAFGDAINAALFGSRKRA